MTPTSDFVRQQEEEKQARELSKVNHQMSWLTVLLGLVIVFLILMLLGTSMTAIAIISGIILIVAIILDFIEKSRQRT